MTFAAACAAVTLATGCGSSDHSSQARSAGGPAGLPQSSERLTLDPGNFTTNIDNPYWPMRPGDSWTFRETGDAGPAKRVVVTVTNRTKRVAAGVTARVVHDRVTQRGRLVEDTLDWYAQDRDGNLWYLGEATTEYANGKPPSTAGSWEAGVGGAQAGVALPAHPRVGLKYRQEYLAGEAEDRASVLSLGERVTVPPGSYTRALMTRDWTPLDKQVVEHKLYVRGVGPVLSLDAAGGHGREALVRFSRG